MKPNYSQGITHTLYIGPYNIGLHIHMHLHCIHRPTCIQTVDQKKKLYDTYK